MSRARCRWRVKRPKKRLVTAIPHCWRARPAPLRSCTSRSATWTRSLPTFGPALPPPVPPAIRCVRFVRGCYGPKATVAAAARHRRRPSSNVYGGWVRCISRQSFARGRTCSMRWRRRRRHRPTRPLGTPAGPGWSRCLCMLRMRTANRIRAC